MSLRDNALRLAELDQNVVRALIECDTEEFCHALHAYEELRKNLKNQLLDKSVISVRDLEAGEILRKIADGDGLRSDEVIRQLSALRDDEPTTEELDDVDIEELGSNLFYSWYTRLLHKSWHVIVTRTPTFRVANASQNSPCSIRPCHDCRPMASVAYPHHR